jgi:hypothetical protein
MDLSYNRKVMKDCRLSRVPSRRTFDRRLAILSNDIKNRITTMGEVFVHEKIIDPCVLSTDSTLVKTKGHVWHKSSIKKKVVPRSGIDTDAMWGFSHTKEGWIFGYKLHLVVSTGSIIVPLTADFTTANIPDNQMYSVMTASLPVTIIREILFMSADPGYDGLCSDKQ